MRLQHARTTLELHELSRRDGPSLLLLHALAGSSTDWSEAPALWPGRVYALDFCGHGRSEWVRGGVYLPELLVGDADVALAHIGAAAVAGAGIGAYVALLLAGGRQDAVPASLLLPGRGLEGGGPLPDFDREVSTLVMPEGTPPLPPDCDPLCGALLWDVRPPDYIALFGRAARRVLLLEDGSPRPPWWERARAFPTARPITGDVGAAFRQLAECV